MGDNHCKPLHKPDCSGDFNNAGFKKYMLFAIAPLLLLFRRAFGITVKTLLTRWRCIPGVVPGCCSTVTFACTMTCSFSNTVQRTAFIRVCRSSWRKTWNSEVIPFRLIHFAVIGSCQGFLDNCLQLQLSFPETIIDMQADVLPGLIKKCSHLEL